VVSFLKIVLTALVGIGLGLLSVHATIHRDSGLGAISSGAWDAWVKRGAQDADPYTRAAVSRFGEMPLGPAEGVTFVARHDDSGAGLDGKCEYRLSGKPVQARFWTLALLSEKGAPSEGGDRASFTSQEVVRGENGEFDIVTSPRARAGNWLRSPADARFVLAMQLYDTTIGSSPASIAGAGLPKISKGACR